MIEDTLLEAPPDDGTKKYYGVTVGRVHQPLGPAGNWPPPGAVAVHRQYRPRALGSRLCAHGRHLLGLILHPQRRRPGPGRLRTRRRQRARTFSAACGTSSSGRPCRVRCCRFALLARWSATRSSSRKSRRPSPFRTAPRRRCPSHRRPFPPDRTRLSSWTLPESR